jgi:hypothetical protein
VYTRAPARERVKEGVAVAAPELGTDRARASGARDPIDRPIFVIGTGRSGTTLFFQLLGFHPDLAWFSTYGNYFYRQTWPALLSRVRDLPGIDRILPPEARYTPKPTESYGILNEVTGQLFTAERRLEASDATPEIAERFRRRVHAYLRLQGKPRFACKHTGFARTRFLRAIFPSARFIHVYRDGRAVANSLIRVGWWRELDSWHWGPMRPEYAEEYKRSGKDRLVLAAISWKTLMDEIEDECRDLPPEVLMRIRYDDLVGDLRSVLGNVLRFAELPDRARFWSRVERHAVHDFEAKWRTDLDARQRELLEKSLSGHLQKYGFTL